MSPQAFEAPPRPAVGDAYVVEEQANPSSDYFVVPALLAQGYRVHRCGFAELPQAAALAGALVVFVRYLPAPWRGLVQSQRDKLAGVILFIDDDLLDVRAAAGMPLRYRYKLFTLTTRHGGWLRSQDVRLWVSTPWLASKYAQWSPLQVAPRPLARTGADCRVFYHGTASHEAEVRWLQPVVEQVLRENPRIAFEIVGGPAVHRLFRGLPQVTVVHPMKWPAFQAFMDMGGRDIGLAPLLPLPFNRARSCTKFIDVTRCGAAGLFASDSLCADVVRDGVDGLLLPMEEKVWAETILQLADDPQRRRRLAAAAAERMRVDLAVAAPISPGTA